MTEGGEQVAVHLDRVVEPFTVVVTRGAAMESVHRGHAVVLDRTGRVHAAWGQIARPVFPRSAIKSIQAIPLVESGAADAAGLSEEDLALACASHAGEQVHTSRVGAWLGRLGLGPDDLECGNQWPTNEATTHAMIRAGETPCPLHNNCSGKHAGMVTTAVHHGEAIAGYVRRDHPVQQRVLGVLEQMTGCALGSAAWAPDGCSIPTVAVPLEGLAFAMARIADPDDLPPARAEAVLRLRGAWAAHPHLVAGTGRFDTEIMQAAGGRVMTKVGAEGVFCGALPEYGLGIALKIEDGADRAASAAMAGLLKLIGALDDADPAIVERWVARPVRTRRGASVGRMEAVFSPG